MALTAHTWHKDNYCFHTLFSSLNLHSRGPLPALCVAIKNASVAVIGIAARLLSLGKLYCSFAERNGILANLPVRRRIALKCGRRFRLHGVLVRMANERLRRSERPSSVYCMHDGPWPLNRALEFSVAPRHNPRHTVVM